MEALHSRDLPGGLVDSLASGRGRHASGGEHRTEVTEVTEEN
jgi:hypothetical protein